MADATELDLLNRKIAADLLEALISSGAIKLGLTGRADVVVPETSKAYRDLLAGIQAAKDA